MPTANGFRDRSSPVQRFYAGTSVFVTGATGFFGKALINKLFRLAPNVGAVYIMIRSKKGKNIEQRLDEFFADPVFDRLKLEVSDFQKRVFPIIGDCEVPNLGLSQSDLDTITSNVNIIFHMAATVNFEENLKTAVKINVSATRDVMEICKKCTALKSIVYVSTAFANCNRSEIEEKFYEPIKNTEKILSFVESQKKDYLESITKKIIDPFPNTYAFTKSLAEDVVRRNCENLPIAVFRPAIVVASYREPIPGWIDNFYGPTGVVMGVASGFMRCIQAAKNNAANLVPVDYVVNAILATAWDVAENQPPTHNQPPIIHYISTNRNPITWKQFCSWNWIFGMAYPSERAIWYYVLIMTTNRYLYLFLITFLHFLPAVLMDGLAWITGSKPRMVKAYKKIHLFLDVLAFFSVNQWTFQDDQIQVLWNKLQPEERLLLPFRIEDLHWDELFFNSMKTMRWYLLKEKDETLPAAQQKMQRLRLLHYTIMYIFVSTSVYIFYHVLCNILNKFLYA